MAMVERQRRLAVLGFRGVGKTNVTLQFVEHRFVGEHDPTIENTFRTSIEFGEAGVVFGTEIIDTAGQDQYSALSRKVSVGIHGYVLVYAINSKESFRNIKLIHDKLLNVLGTTKIPCVIAGNKCDAEAEREVSLEEGKAYADELGCPFVECSAKANINIPLVFRSLLMEVERDTGLLNRRSKPGCVLL